MALTKIAICAVLAVCAASAVTQERELFPVLQSGHASAGAVSEPGAGRITPDMLPNFNGVVPQMMDKIADDWKALAPVATTTKHNVRPMAGFVVPKYDGPPIDPDVARKKIEETPGFTFRATHGDGQVDRYNTQTDFYTADITSFIEENKIWLEHAEAEHMKVSSVSKTVKPVYDNDAAFLEVRQDPADPAASNGRVTPNMLPDFNGVVPQTTGTLAVDWKALAPVRTTVHHNVRPQPGFVQPQYDLPEHGPFVGGGFPRAVQIQYGKNSVGGDGDANIADDGTMVTGTEEPEVNPSP